MKYIFTLFLVTISLITVAQSVVYQGFEADSAAVPRAGMPFLGIFLQANLRKPVVAEAGGKGGRVILSAIIEPDGQSSDVKVIQAFRPDCGQEALRVFARFRAWKPAYKDGKPVRQAVTIPVMFPANEPFRYENGAKITYYDEKEQLLPDSSDKVRYRQVAPVDTNGIPIGDMLISEWKKNGWKETNRVPLLRLKESWQSESGLPVFSVGYKGPGNEWNNWMYNIDANGMLIKRSLYTDGKKLVSEFVYYPNGMVAQQRTLAGERNSLVAWYPTGQIRQVWTDETNGSNRISHPGQIISHWDSTGNPLVTDGNGYVIYQELVNGPGRIGPPTELIESGTFAAGVRNGRWTGRYADGSYYYEEEYDRGLFKAGKAVFAGQDTVRYTVMEQQPEFKGGMEKLGQFLAQNLQYPPEAQRIKAAGKVLISFVVNTDGSVGDCLVVRGVHPDVDKEAIRVVQATSGRWKPGVQRGSPVRVKYMMPINFSLN